MSECPVERVDLSNLAGPPGTVFETLDDLRARHRWFRNDIAQGYWVLTRFDDIREAFQTPEVFSNRSIVPVDPNPEYRFMPSLTDPPMHMKYRAPLARWFSPHSIAKYTQAMTDSCNEIIDGFVDDGGVEFCSGFADWLPALTLTHILHLPRQDAPFFISCANRIRGHVNADDAVVAMRDIKAYFVDVLAGRRRAGMDPDVDFLTYMLEAEVDGRPFDDEELLDTLMTLAFGSLDTTKTAMTWSTWHLATNPADREWVVADPSIIPSAIEEFLRAYPVVSMARKVNHDVDFHGCPMKKDDMVLLTIQAATRDPEVFDEPAKVRLDRSPNRHIAFGASEHRCLGSHLARAELKIAMEKWHERIPVYRVADGAEITARGSHIEALPLTWAGS